jgi:hypothetical protein
MAPAGEATAAQNGRAHVTDWRMPTDSTEKVGTVAEPGAQMSDHYKIGWRPNL